MNQVISDLTVPYSQVGDGYLILHHEGHKLLLDTGAPFSFGSGLSGIPGVSGSPPPGLSNGLSIGWLVDHVGHTFDGLIGAEVLAHQTLTIDPDIEAVTFSDRVQSSRNAGAVSLKSASNVPLLEAMVDGHKETVIFDTGACIGFVPERFVTSFDPVREQDEFYPLFGPFRTEVYRLRFSTGSIQVWLEFGVFPPEIEELHAQAGMSVLVGLELLRTYRITLGHREQTMYLQPRIASL